MKFSLGEIHVEYSTRMKFHLLVTNINICSTLAVASVARYDPSPLPSMHRDHNALPS